jgi:hypothetical protein
MGASWRGHVSIVQLLLQHGAIIDARTNVHLLLCRILTHIAQLFHRMV